MGVQSLGGHFAILSQAFAPLEIHEFLSVFGTQYTRITAAE